MNPLCIAITPQGLSHDKKNQSANKTRVQIKLVLYNPVDIVIFTQCINSNVIGISP